MTAAGMSERIMEQLLQVRALCPELRLGQLIATIGMLAEDETGHSLWDVEDTDFAAALERFAGDMARRALNRAEPGTTPDRGGKMASCETTSPRPPQQVS
jgi:hypothetical protein